MAGVELQQFIDANRICDARADEMRGITDEVKVSDDVHGLSESLPSDHCRKSKRLEDWREEMSRGISLRSSAVMPSFAAHSLSSRVTMPTRIGSGSRMKW